MYLGDSKTYGGTWPTTLEAGLRGRAAASVTGHNGGVNSATVATALAGMDAILAGFPTDGVDGVSYKAVLMNWGVNDFALAPDPATWRANYLAIIDKVHTKAPNAKVYLMRPWAVGGDAYAATYAGYIATVAGSRTFTYVGPDEAVWLKGSDNGASETADGIHYSALGNSLCAAQWQTVLGY